MEGRLLAVDGQIGSLADLRFGALEQSMYVVFVPDDDERCAEDTEPDVRHWSVAGRRSDD